MERPTTKDLRDYAWDYFSLHAEQRLKTFHFFILISAFIFTSCAAITRFIESSMLLALPMFAISILAFVFWELDKRNKQLVRVGEESLKEIESKLIEKGLSVELCPFTNEENKTRNIRNNKFLNLSYSNCFGLVFLSFGLTGLVIGSIGILSSISCVVV